MGNVKLMKPLFYKGRYNAAGRRMKCVIEREISSGADRYRLWRSNGRPDIQYPRAENDAYILYVEIGEYLAPLGMTEFALVDHCGYSAAADLLYGGMEGRRGFFNDLRESAEDDSIAKAIDREREEIIRLGSDLGRQADYIKSVLDGHVSTYLTSKSNGGESFPDFIGAAVLGETAYCAELSAIYQENRKIMDRVRKEQIEAKDRAYCEEKNRVANQAVAEAIRIIKDGGVLRNSTARFYRGRHEHSDYSIVNYLFRLYKINVPLRTQGWINDKLVNVTINEGKCTQLQYKQSKGGRCSQKIFDCINELLHAVNADSVQSIQEESEVQNESVYQMSQVY